MHIIESRLTRLSYAPEIAQAMLRQQQASAVVGARQRIVEGAVGMVKMALERLEEEGVVELDEERKAVMVSNLLVVLCSEQATQQVVNTGIPLPVTGGQTEGRSRERAQERPAPARPCRPRRAGQVGCDELRSTNAQIEFLLRRALADAGRLPGRARPMRPRGRPPAVAPAEAGQAAGDDRPL